MPSPIAYRYSDVSNHWLSPLGDVLRRPSFLVALSVVGLVLNTIGTGLSPSLLANAPELLLALNASNLTLLLVAHQVAFWVFFGVGLARLMVTDVAPYLLGRFHGRSGVELVVRNERSRRLIDEHTDQLRLFALIALVLASTSLVAAVAGFARVRPVTFLALNTAGSAARLALFWWLADIFSDQLDAVHDFIEDWERWLLVGGVTLTAAAVLWRYRRNHRGPASL